MDGGLYVLTRGTSAFTSTLKNKQSHASYDLCHSCIGHVNNSFISSLNKKKAIFLLVPYCLRLIYAALVNLQKVIVYHFFYDILVINADPLTF